MKVSLTAPRIKNPPNLWSASDLRANAFNFLSIPIMSPPPTFGYVAFTSQVPCVLESFSRFSVIDRLLITNYVELS